VPLLLFLVRLATTIEAHMLSVLETLYHFRMQFHQI